MDESLSLKSGKYIAASSATYRSCQDLLLVCPECGEPVFLKNRQIPYRTAFFSHYKEIEYVKLRSNCTLRISGSEFKSASNLLPSIKHGQLVDKFQKYFCFQLYEMLGRCSEPLINFIKASNFLNLSKKDYKFLITQIDEADLFSSININSLNSSDLTYLRDGKSDICTFLHSQYGIWVGNFIYRVSYFLACVIHKDTIRLKIGENLFVKNSERCVFVIDPSLLKNHMIYASEILKENSERNKVIPNICSALVTFIIMYWRQSKGLPKLVTIDANINITLAPSSIPSEPRYSSLDQKKAAVKQKLDDDKNTSFENRWVEQLTAIKEIDRITPLSLKKIAKSSNSRQDNDTDLTYSRTINTPSNSHNLQKNSIKVFNKSTSNPIIKDQKNKTLHYKQILKNIRSEFNIQSKKNHDVPTKEVKFNYSVNPADSIRINSLISKSKSLPKSIRLTDRESIFNWANTKNPLEAYFLARRSGSAYLNRFTPRDKDTAGGLN